MKLEKALVGIPNFPSVELLALIRELENEKWHNAHNKARGERLQCLVDLLNGIIVRESLVRDRLLELQTAVDAHMEQLNAE